MSYTNNLQSNLDPNYLPMSDLHITNNNHINNDSLNNSRQISSSMSRISNVSGSAGGAGGGSGNIFFGPQTTSNYKLYDRNNVLVSSKVINPKNIENFQHGKIYYNHPVGYVINNSPTHSHSGSSQHSESPRTSIIGTNNGIGSSGNIIGITTIGGQNYISGPVYENIEYLTQQIPPEQLIYYSSGNFESNNKKAQPQVPNNGVIVTTNQNINNNTNNTGVIFLTHGGRYAHTPQPEIDQPPIYENIPAVTGNLLLITYLCIIKHLLKRYFSI